MSKNFKQPLNLHFMTYKPELELKLQPFIMLTPAALSCFVLLYYLPVSHYSWHNLKDIQYTWYVIYHHISNVMNHLCWTHHSLFCLLIWARFSFNNISYSYEHLLVIKNAIYHRRTRVFLHFSSLILQRESGWWPGIMSV